MTTSPCDVCQRIELIKRNENPHFVKEMKTGYVVLGQKQFFRGYTVFLSKQHIFELHELDRESRQLFLNEMSLVAEAVYRAFKPVKMNYELLGTGTPHMHWHLFPRHKDDPLPGRPVWYIPDEVRDSPKSIPTDAQRNALKKSCAQHRIASPDM
ncbi:MAG: HIT family protein [SAR202 cluster bacterium]|nr:HIT family protein [SAR202 cluster bacterium]